MERGRAMCCNYLGDVPAVTGILQAGTRLVPAGAKHYMDAYIWYVQVPGSPVAYVSRMNILMHSHCDVPRTCDNTRNYGNEERDRRLQVVKLLTALNYCVGGSYILSVFQHYS